MKLFIDFAHFGPGRGKVQVVGAGGEASGSGDAGPEGQDRPLATAGTVFRPATRATLRSSISVPSPPAGPRAFCPPPLSSTSKKLKKLLLRVIAHNHLTRSPILNEEKDTSAPEKGERPPPRAQDHPGGRSRPAAGTPPRRRGDPSE